MPIESVRKKLKLDPSDTRDILQTPVKDGRPILLTKARKGDRCPSCKDGKLKLQQAVEIGHTFYLGTRYSAPLEAHVLGADNKQVPIQMGCHGIGVSRLIGAVASLLADGKGLNWPLAISPFDLVIVPAGKTEPSHIQAMYDQLTKDPGSEGTLDVAIDNRDRPVGWKLNDADLIGYPFIVVLGKAWKDRQVVELQCRRLGLKMEVGGGELVESIRRYSAEL